MSFPAMGAKQDSPVESASLAQRERRHARGASSLACSTSRATRAACPWDGVTRTGVSGRVAELILVSIADQGLKRDVIACPGRRECHVSVL